MNNKNYLQFAHSASGVYRDGHEIPFREKIIRPCESDIAVSLILTVFNRAHLVRESIESVFRCEQKRGAVEIIAVDDGSSDESVSVLKEYLYDERFNLIALQNNSGSEALPKNIATFFAKGKYISYLDSDDRIGDISAFDESFAAIEKETGYVMTVSNLVFEIRCSREKIAASMPWLLNVDGYNPAINIRHPTAKEYRRRLAKEHTVYELLNHGYYDAFKLMRKDIFMKTGGVVEDMLSCGDFGLYLKLNRHGRTLAVPKDFYVYVIHGDNDSFYPEEYRGFQEEKHRAFALAEIRLRGLKYDDLRRNCQHEFWDRYSFSREEIEDNS